MTKHRVSDLSGTELDLAVAQALGETFVRMFQGSMSDGWYAPASAGVAPQLPRYSSDWGAGGPIIERERIAIYFGDERSGWDAGYDLCAGDGPGIYNEHGHWSFQPLVAAMQAFVSKKLGDLVDLPI